MTLKAFIGSAGTGKTTCLMQSVDAWAAGKELGDTKKVLALTRMHGSRRRLIEKLQGGSAKKFFDCMTLDRFGWIIASRWRSLSAAEGIGNAEELDYEGTSRVASSLLQHPSVRQWVRSTYPLVVIDEFQDCHTYKLALVEQLAAEGDTLLAADDFQNLSDTGVSAAVAWARQHGDVVELTKTHRFSASGLVNAATALRTGIGKLAKGPGFELFAAQNANVAASYLARGIAWSKGGTVTVISPTGPASSPFVGDALARLAEKPFVKDKNSVGPYSVRWQLTAEEARQRLLSSTTISIDTEWNRPRLIFAQGAHLQGQLAFEQWFDQQRRLSGRITFTDDELGAAAAQAVHTARAHHVEHHWLNGMVVHQAKNREFDEVLILWPLKVVGNLDAQRRLLYNAVTRAKRKATVIVQDPTGKRLMGPLFVGGAATVG